MKETWSNIKGNLNYQISNFGRVKSLSRRVQFGKDSGKRFRTIPEKILTPVLDDKGYYQVTIDRSFTGAKRNKKIHRLVAETFMPKIKGKRFVNHKDGIKTNNRVKNLEWATKSEDVQHSYNVLKRKSFFDGKEATWNNIPVIKLDKHTRKPIKKYKSVTRAAIATKSFSGNIIKCINGKRNHAGGFKWKYA